MSTVRYFRWDDPGAPSLTGEVGSLTNLLRKCLVGAGGVAYGSKEAAGWSEEFVGAATNVAVFKNSLSAGGSECCVRVNDNAPSGSDAREAVAVVYEAMTDIDNGINPLTGVWFRKSGTTSSAARPWLIVADGRTAWLFGWNNGEAFGEIYATSLIGFGDLAVDGGSVPFFALGRASGAQNGGGTVGALIAAGGSSGFSGLSVSDAKGISGPYSSSVVVPTPASAAGGIGGRGYENTSSPGDSLIIQGSASVSYGSRYLGAMRGVMLPVFNVGSVSVVVGGGLPGYPGAIVTRVHTVNGDAGWLAYLLIDVEGPWK